MVAPGERLPGGDSEPEPMNIEQMLAGPPHEGDTGQGLVFRTNRGDLRAILHESADSDKAVVWVCGALGGFGGPGPGIYAGLSEALRGRGITSLRMDYRQPNVMDECVMDTLAGTAFLKATGYAPVVLVGHSFGGAVVIAAGAASSHVNGVVSLSPQTAGTASVAQLSPQPLLVVHGKNDTRLPYTCAQQIYAAAQEPKKLVLYDGAEHRLAECRDELEELLSDWITATLAAPVT